MSEQNKAPEYRVKFVYDTDARFEESNGEERPLTRSEYRKAQYMACPVHLQGDKANDTTVPGKPGLGRCACGLNYAPVPYDEYLRYYGNPERHVYLGCVVEKRCECCGTYKTAASLWRIDFMDDDREYLSVQIDHWYTADEALALYGYLAEVSREELDEAGYKTTTTTK